jgi:ABC-type multidrug transport system fused ATPase/permease subunit
VRPSSERRLWWWWWWWRRRRQTPWVFSGSVRDNVVFGRDFDEARYREAVAACALGPDVAALPDGDATELGERGVNLSGGQVR